jgi:hypothetical protein
MLGGPVARSAVQSDGASAASGTSFRRSVDGGGSARWTDQLSPISISGDQGQSLLRPVFLDSLTTHMAGLSGDGGRWTFRSTSPFCNLPDEVGVV